MSPLERLRQIIIDDSTARTIVSDLITQGALQNQIQQPHGNSLDRYFRIYSFQEIETDDLLPTLKAVAAQSDEETIAQITTFIVGAA